MVTNNQATQTEPETAELVNMFCPIDNVCEQELVSKNGWGNGVKCPWGECLLFTFMEVVIDNYTRNCRNKTGNSWRVSVISQ